jgi:hypothetical protein
MLYYYSGMLSINMNRESYNNLKKIFFEIKDTILTYYDKRLIYARLSNFCSIIPGIEYKKEHFRLYTLMLDDNENVMHEGPYFSRIHFRNIINLAIPLGELDWAGKFIGKYSIMLNPADMENMLNFAYGYLSFGKKEYEKSLEYLSRVKFGFATFKEDVNFLTLFNHYELGMYEQALSLVSSYKRTFKRTPSMHEALYESYMSTLKCYPLLLKAKLNNDLSDMVHIEELSKKCINLTVKNWITEKISELKKEAD